MKITQKTDREYFDTSKHSGAVIVCSHVALGKPILFAARSQPDEAIDTGWQFVCNSGVEETIDTAKVWALNEVLSLEPSLQDFIDLPIGTELERTDAKSPWKISHGS
jgi:hypothetical protein